MSDIYDDEIVRLRLANDPVVTFAAWNDYAPLFKRVKVLDTYRATPNDYGEVRSCGCLTQVRHKPLSYGAQAFEEEIKNDARIPLEPIDPRGSDSEEVQARHEAILSKLEVFAEWQRRIDHAI